MPARRGGLLPGGPRAAAPDPPPSTSRVMLDWKVRGTEATRTFRG